MMNSKAVEKWLGKISKAEKAYETYHELIKEIRDYYKNAKKNNKSNIFWSSIETLKPFLYFKQPRPYVERRNKKSNQAETLACKILERALEWDLEQFDFDSVIKYARNDFLLSGLGLAWEQYTAEFEKVADIEVKTSEQVKTVYVDPTKFIADSEKVGIWEDVEWIARIIEMTRGEAVANFGSKFEEAFKNIDPSDKEWDKKETKVYEIWDKKTKKIYWISKDYKKNFLRETNDPLNLSGFFPCPKPIFATVTNDSLIPVPDYSEIRELLCELDGINTRMQLTMQALKVSGAYDNSFPELASILNKDVTLVAVKDFARLKEAGGISGIMDFAPIQQYISALQALAERRQDLTAQIYEITGVSDIMRGNSDPNDTATAVTKKTNFGTLRNQDRQNDMQRFLCDLFKIKAEIICEQFSDESLVQFLDAEDLQNPELPNAIALLKTDKMRGMALGIETDTIFNQEAEAEKTFDAVKTVNEMINAAFPVISSQPLLLPLYRQMVTTVTATLPNARQFEPVLEEVFANIQNELAQPQPEQPNPEMAKVQLQAQKNQQEYAIKQEQNAIKRGELELKRQIEQTDAALANKEMELQASLRQQEIIQKGETNTNISTGFVGSFE